MNERIRSLWTPDVVVPKGAPDLLRPIAIVRVSEDEFRARLTGASTTGLSRLRACQRLLHHALGLLPEAPSEETPNLVGFLNAHTQLPTAVYLPGRDTILVYYQNPTTIQHEWLHALEDQRGTRFALMKTATTTDERLALRTASEGFALARSGGLQTSYRSSGDLDGVMLRVSYSVGGRFFRNRSINWEEDISFAPTSLADLLGTTGYQSHPGEMLADGCTDRLGPVGILAIASLAPAESEDPLRLAERWLGDSARLTRSTDGDRATWSIWLRETPSTRGFKARTEASAGRRIAINLVP